MRRVPEWQDELEAAQQEVIYLSVENDKLQDENNGLKIEVTELRQFLAVVMAFTLKGIANAA
jgi:regulator of replication initiation timing